MADVAFDAATSAAPSSGTTRTWSHTCTGADRLLLVNVEIASTNDWVTGVTYNAVAMTRLDIWGEFTTMTTYLYGILAPATGANNIVVTSSDSVAIAGCGYSLNGAKQSLTLDVVWHGNAGTPATSRLFGPTTTTVDRALVALFGWNSAEVPVAGTNLTNRSVVNREAFVGDRGGITTPAGDVYLTQDTTGSTTWSTIGVSVAPVPAGGAIAVASAYSARRRRGRG